MLKTTFCVSCGQYSFTNTVLQDNGEYCQDCYRLLFCTICENCKEYVVSTEIIELPDTPGVYRCSVCMNANDEYYKCASCNKYCEHYINGCTTIHDNQIVCDRCFNLFYSKCCVCSAVFKTVDTVPNGKDVYCNKCFGVEE